MSENKVNIEVSNTNSNTAANGTDKKDLPHDHDADSSISKNLEGKSFLETVARIALWITFFIYMILFIPQLVGNLQQPERLSKLSLWTMSMFFIATSCDLMYTWGLMLPIQNRLPPIAELTGLILQEVQLYLYWKRKVYESETLRSVGIIVENGSIIGEDTHNVVQQSINMGRQRLSLNRLRNTTSVGDGGGFSNVEGQHSMADNGNDSDRDQNNLSGNPNQSVKFQTVTKSNDSDADSDELLAANNMLASKDLLLRKARRGCTVVYAPDEVKEQQTIHNNHLMAVILGMLIIVLPLASWFLSLSQQPHNPAKEDTSSFEHKIAIFLGFTAMSFYFFLYIPQIVLNFQLETAGAIGPSFICLSLSIQSMKLFAAITLNLPWVSKLSPALTLCLKCTLLYQYFKYGGKDEKDYEKAVRVSKAAQQADAELTMIREGQMVEGMNDDLDDDDLEDFLDDGDDGASKYLISQSQQFYRRRDSRGTSTSRGSVSDASSDAQTKPFDPRETQTFTIMGKSYTLGKGGTVSISNNDIQQDLKGAGSDQDNSGGDYFDSILKSTSPTKSKGILSSKSLDKNISRSIAMYNNSNILSQSLSTTTSGTSGMRNAMNTKGSNTNSQNLMNESKTISQLRSSITMNTILEAIKSDSSQSESNSESEKFGNKQQKKNLQKSQMAKDDALNTNSYTGKGKGKNDHGSTVQDSF